MLPYLHGVTRPYPGLLALIFSPQGPLIPSFHLTHSCGYIPLSDHSLVQPFLSPRARPPSFPSPHLLAPPAVNSLPYQPRLTIQHLSASFQYSSILCTTIFLSCFSGKTSNLVNPTVCVLSAPGLTQLLRTDEGCVT